MIDNELESKQFEFEATITNCRYYNHDTSWGVYRFSTKHDLPYLDEVKGDVLWGGTEEQEIVTFGNLVGKMQELNIGCKYNVVATLEESKYGYQYNPINVFAIAPKSTEDQLLFLSVMVNENVAKNILEKYPNVVGDVINGDLVEIDYKNIKGVGKKTWDKIRNKILDNYVMSDIIVMLRPIGVTFNMIKTLVDDEKNISLLKQKLEKNPYLLTKIRGLGFKRVDDFAIKLNSKFTTSYLRLASFIRYYFQQLGENDGDTWCYKNVLLNEIKDNIPECVDLFDHLLENNKFLNIEDNKIGLHRYMEIELDIYNMLAKKAAMKQIISIPQDVIDESIKEAEDIQGFSYTKEQLETINNALKNNLSIITGKAGVGKSSIMRAIMIAFRKNKNFIESCALSAMAAKRIEDASGFPSKTIHRALGSKGDNKFTYDKDNPMGVDVVVLDEGSMVGASLFHHLVEAIGPRTVVIISGDHKQLPPIGYGNIFSDLIDIFDYPIVNMLTKPMRQAQESGILVDANVIRENINPITEEIAPKLVHGKLQDMYYMFRNDRDTLSKIAIKTYLSAIKTCGQDNVIIITPRKQGCNNSTAVINRRIQSILMKDKGASEKVTFGSNNEKVFYIGDRVMQTVNNYDENVFNGDIGYLTDIYVKTNDSGKKEIVCEVTFKTVVDYDGKEKVVKYKYSDLIELELAYALTCHKIQGAGIHTVIGIIDNTHYTLLDNCMLYTMLTRAKKRCLLLAEPSAFKTCITNSKNNRKTWLSIENV